MTLLGAAEVRRLAAAGDIRPSKARGQNFVVDDFEISFFRNCTILGSDMMESQKTDRT